MSFRTNYPVSKQNRRNRKEPGFDELEINTLSGKIVLIYEMPLGKKKNAVTVRNT